LRLGFQRLQLRRGGLAVGGQFQQIAVAARNRQIVGAQLIGQCVAGFFIGGNVAVERLDALLHILEFFFRGRRGDGQHWQPCQQQSYPPWRGRGHATLAGADGRVMQKSAPQECFLRGALAPRRAAR
jgi:hypothetical protein